MKILLLIIALFLSTGCEGLKKIIDGAESHPPVPIVYGNPHIVQGVTVFDYQWIEYVPFENRIITVEVKEPFATEFRTLNPYEYNLHGGSVPALEFRTYAIFKNGLVIIPWPRRPTAPIGTEFIITSQLE